MPVDDHEFHFREFLGDGLHRLPLGEADGGDQVHVFAGEIAQYLFGLRIAADLDFQVVDLGFFFKAFRTFRSRLIEGFVELAACIIDHGQLGIGRIGADCAKQGGGSETETIEFHAVQFHV